MSMPEMPTGAWNDEDLTLFWYFVRWFIAENQMWVMIVGAFFLAVGVCAIILNVIIPDKKKDDDDGVDYL